MEMEKLFQNDIENPFIDIENPFRHNLQDDWSVLDGE